MSDAQLDMFEVQLGSAMLLQMRAHGRVFAVLVDAGISAAGYAEEHVRDKLPEALDAFERGNRRIDLIIGSHYDRDHLAGLAPILRDEQFEIGEVWLPPVRNDRAAPQRGRARGAPFLADQFGESPEAFVEYVRGKLADSAFFAARARARQSGDRGLTAERVQDDLRSTADDRNAGMDAERWHRVRAALTVGETSTASGLFDGYVHEAQAAVESAGGDLDASVEAPGEAISRLVGGGAGVTRIGPRTVRRSAERILPASRVDPEVTAANLAFLAAGSAHDGISAIALEKVVSAARGRSTPIFPVAHVITPGKPKRFGWDSASRSYKEAAPVRKSVPSITLLGPSQALVDKHADRLPVGQYAALARAFTIPIKGITPSNELSYVVRVDFGGQRILLCGDTGMVDFIRGRKLWHRRLIAELRDLSLVQVAHHAGRNAYFYRALLEAATMERSADDEFHLLSHATHDKTRPSPEFAMFAADRARSRRRIRLLFTSTPDIDKIRTYRSLVEPVAGAPSPQSDVRLSWSADDRRWQVDRHGVVPA